MCYYLNVHFQGQRVKVVLQDPPKDFSLSHWKSPWTSIQFKFPNINLGWNRLFVSCSTTLNILFFSRVCSFPGEVLSYMEHQFRDAWHRNFATDTSKFCVLTGNVFQLFRFFEKFCFCSL